MNQWMLVMVLHISGPPGEIRDPTVQVMDGFSSRARCDATAMQISESLISSIGRARIAQGIKGERWQHFPKIHHQCIEVQK